MAWQSGGGIVTGFAAGAVAQAISGVALRAFIIGVIALFARRGAAATTYGRGTAAVTRARFFIAQFGGGIERPPLFARGVVGFGHRAGIAISRGAGAFCRLALINGQRISRALVFNTIIARQIPPLLAGIILPVIAFAALHATSLAIITAG